MQRKLQNKLLLTFKINNKMELKSHISVHITPSRYKLNDDLEKYLLHHDFEFSIYDDIEEYLEDFLETHEIDWHRSVFYKVQGRHVYYSFDVTAFNSALNNKYDTDDYDT
jgi:hypothetical protein